MLIRSSNLVQPSLLSPSWRVYSASFSLEIAAQRLVSVTRQPRDFLSPWLGERILEVPLRVQCRHYASSTHTTPPSRRKYLWLEMCLDVSSFKVVPCRLVVLPVTSEHATPDTIGPLSNIKAFALVFCLSYHNNMASVI